MLSEFIENSLQKKDKEDTRQQDMNKLIVSSARTNYQRVSCLTRSIAHNNSNGFSKILPTQTQKRMFTVCKQQKTNSHMRNGSGSNRQLDDLSMKRTFHTTSNLMAEKNPYKVLGVDKAATKDDIKKKYKEVSWLNVMCRWFL